MKLRSGMTYGEQIKSRRGGSVKRRNVSGREKITTRSKSCIRSDNIVVVEPSSNRMHTMTLRSRKN